MSELNTVELSPEDRAYFYDSFSRVGFTEDETTELLVDFMDSSVCLTALLPENYSKQRMRATIDYYVRLQQGIVSTSADYSVAYTNLNKQLNRVVIKSPKQRALERLYKLTKGE